MLIQRRLPQLWLLALGLLMSFSLGIAYGSVLLPVVGWIATLVTSIPVVALWFKARSDIAIDDSYLRIGKIQLELEFVGEIKPLSPAELLNRLRTGAQAGDLLLILNPKYGGIEIENLDESDPFRRYLVSVRNPESVAHKIKAELPNS